MDWRVAKLIGAIDSHTGGIAWNLEVACRELGLNISPEYARHLFKRDTGLGVKEYAKKKRLLMVAERLINTNVPFKTIAADFGYRKTYDLARLFKKQYCLSPTKFRQANRLRSVC
jgi:methylphosphotriester-DNA--protein-cysteine methyltransferase